MCIRDRCLKSPRGEQVNHGLFDYKAKKSYDYNKSQIDIDINLTLP